MFDRSKQYFLDIQSHQMQLISLLVSAYDDSYFDCLSNQMSLMSHTAHHHGRQCEVDFDLLNFESMNNQFELRLISLHNLPELWYIFIII